MACSTSHERLTGSHRAWTQYSPSPQPLPATHQWQQRAAAAERRASGEASTSSPAAAAGHGFRSSRCQTKRPSSTSTKALERPGAFDPFLPPPSPRSLAPAPVPRPQFLRPSKLSAPVITTLIKRCETVAELQTVFAAHSPAFNHIHISAALMHTLALAALESGRVGGARHGHARSSWQSKEGHASPLGSASSSSPADAAAAGGQDQTVSPASGSSPDGSVSDQAAAQQQQQPSPSSNPAESPAPLSRPSPPAPPPSPPPPASPSGADALLSQLFAMVPQQLEFFDVQALANAIYAMAKAGYRNTQLLESLLASVQYRMDVGLPQNISNILWGCATLGYTPERDWLAMCYDAIDDIIADFNPQDLSNVLWAFANFELNDSSSRRSSSSSSSSRVADDSSSTTTASASACSNASASADETSAPLPADVPPSAASPPPPKPPPKPSTYKVPPTVIGKLLLQSFPLLPRFSAQQLANCAWSLGRLGFMPPPAWNQQFLAASAFRLRAGDCHPSELCGLVTGISRLRLAVGPAWADAFYVASMQQLAFMSADETAQVLLSIGALRLRPPSAWVLSFISSVTRRRQQFGPQALSSALLGVARLQRAAAAGGPGPGPSPGPSGGQATAMRPVGGGDSGVKALGRGNGDVQFAAPVPAPGGGGVGAAAPEHGSGWSAGSSSGHGLNSNGSSSGGGLNGSGLNGSSSGGSSGQGHAAVGWSGADRNGSTVARNGSTDARNLGSTAEGIGVVRPRLFPDASIARNLDLDGTSSENGSSNGNLSGNGVHALLAASNGSGASNGVAGRPVGWPAPTERAQDMLMLWLEEIEGLLPAPEPEATQQQQRQWGEDGGGDGGRQAQPQRQRQRQLNSQELSNVLFSVAAVGLRPERRWMQRLLAALRPCMASLAAVPRRGAMVAWALRSMRVRPDAGWLGAFGAATGPRRLRAVGSMELSSLLSAFAGWRLVPPAPWLARFWWQSGSLLDRGLFPPRHLASLLASMTALRLAPHSLWARVCCRCMAKGMAAGAFPAHLLSSCARSLALLGVEPERSWARAALAASFKCWGSFQPAQWAELMWALTKMKVFLPLEWLDRFASTTQLQLHRFNGQQLATVLWVLCKRGYQPPQPWIQSFLAASKGQMAGMTDSQLANMVWYLNRLRALGPGVEDGGWVRGLVQVLRTRQLSEAHSALMERASKLLIHERRRERETAKSKGARKLAAAPPPLRAASKAASAAAGSRVVVAQEPMSPSPPPAPQRPPPGPPHSPPHVSLQLSAADLTLEGLSSGGCCGQGRPGGPGCELHLPAGISEAGGHMQGLSGSAALDGVINQAVPVSVK